MLEQAPPGLTARRAIEAARVIRAGNIVLGPDLPTDPELFVWSATLKIKEQSEVHSVLDVIEGMDSQEQAVAFELNVGANMAVTFTEMCYSIEADKPPDDQNWDSVLATLDRFESVGRSEAAEVLRWAAMRARAMVLADFMDEVEEALLLLEEGASKAEGAFKYLLKFTLACILLRKGEDDPAFKEFSEASAMSAGEVFPFYFSEGLRRGMIAASKTGNWSTAKVWCLRLMREGSFNTDLSAHEWTELLGELAWIHWSTGHRKKACGAMFGVVLLSSGSDARIGPHGTSWRPTQGTSPRAHGRRPQASCGSSSRMVLSVLMNARPT